VKERTKRLVFIGMALLFVGGSLMSAVSSL
jgi:hypothetical protein